MAQTGQTRGQHWCGTETNAQIMQDYAAFLSVQQRPGSTQLDTFMNFPIQLHVITDLNQTIRISQGTLISTICELNDRYAPVRFRFFLRGDINYISNNAWATLPSKTVGDQIMLQHNVNRVINVYFTDLSQLNPPLCGYAYFPGTGPGTTFRQGGLFMGTNGNCSSNGNTTFAHEMGHYFQLMHPFQGTSSLNKFSPSFERVTRNFNEISPRLNANCNTAGDQLCDTPTDWIGDRWNCNVAQPVQTDLNNDTIRPDATLYMGYADDACQSRFSPQQIALMRTTGNTSRAYLKSPPMEPFDTILTTTSNVEPANNTQLVNPQDFTLRWNKINGATAYAVRISRSPTFNTIDFETIVTGDTSFRYFVTGATKFIPNVNYSWSVKPYNHAVLCTPFSPATRFRAGFVGTQNLDSEMGIYPNVVQNGESTKIQFKNPMSGYFQAQVIDMNGRLIRTEAFEGQNQTEFTMGMFGMSQGLYLVRVQTEAGTMTQRVVVR